MAYQPLEKLLPHANNSIYRLILMASKRATELADGAPKLIEFPSSTKTATIALDEILHNKIDLKEVDEANKKAEKAQKAENKKKEKE